MSDETTPKADEKPAAENTNGTTSEDKGTQTTPEAQAKEIADLKAELKRINHESAARRKKLEEYEAKERAEQDKTKSTEEKLAEVERRAVDAETRLKETTLRQKVVETALAEGLAMQAARDVFALLDLSTVDYDETSGEPTNLKGLVDEMLKTRPYLKTGTGPKAPVLDGKTRGDGKFVIDDATEAKIKLDFGLGGRRL